MLAGLEGLSNIHHGSLIVEPDNLILRGSSGSEETTSELSRLLAQHLGAAASFEIDVAYMASLDPVSGELSPQQCLDRINAVQAERKITFDAGSIEINTGAGEILDELAEILRECSSVEFEIGGHTDAQGREETRRIEFMLLTDIRQRDLIEAAAERAEMLANARRPVMRPTGLAPTQTEENTE